MHSKDGHFPQAEKNFGLAIKALKASAALETKATAAGETTVDSDGQQPDRLLSAGYYARAKYWRARKMWQNASLGVPPSTVQAKHSSAK